MSGDDATTQRRQELYADRWSGFGESAGVRRISDKPTVEELQELELFQDYDASFLERHTQDIAFVEWESDATLFEEGSYLDLAFFVVEGEVELFLEEQQHQEQTAGSTQPIFDVTSLIDSETDAADDEMMAESLFQQQVEEKKTETNTAETTFLATMDFNLETGQKKRLGSGEIFGEIGALNGWPQSVTARTATPNWLPWTTIRRPRKTTRPKAMIP
mgnify:CR=1 FL=1